MLPQWVLIVFEGGTTVGSIVFECGAVVGGGVICHLLASQVEALPLPCSL